MTSEFSIREIPFGAMGGVYEEDDVEAVMRVVRAATELGGNFFTGEKKHTFFVTM